MPNAAPAGEPATAESLGWQLRSALPPLRLHSVSICNVEGDVLWLSEGALGPDEHSVLIEAVEQLTQDPSQPYHECGMEDGRIAIFLAIRVPQGDLVALAMILAELKGMQDGLVERIVSPQMRAILQKVAVLLRPPPTKSAAPAPTTAAPAPAAITAPASQPPAAKSDAKSPEEIELEDFSGVETILTLELIEDAPEITPDEEDEKPAAKAKPAAPKAASDDILDGLSLAPDAPAAKPAKRAEPPEIATPFTLASDEETKVAPTPAAAKPGSASGRAQPGLAEPIKSPAEIEDLLSMALAPDDVPTVKAPSPPPPAPAKGSKPAAVAAVEKAPVKPTVEARNAPPRPDAKRAPVQARPPVERLDPEKIVAEALAADRAAAAKPVVERRSPGRLEADRIVAEAAQAADRAAAAKSSERRIPERLDPERIVAEALAADRAAAQKPAAKPAAARAPEPTVESEAADDLDVTIESEALVEAEPSAPLDPASDLTLHVQQLVKLRSNGRTRRFEVLARSRRNPTTNQVPDAFIADSSKGREGAVLDGLVLQRLLQWLGENPTVWNSEPASFSINLSIGALEDENFPQRVASWLSVSGVSPECIGFEITEFAAIQCKKQVQRFVDAVEKLGCFLVLDNFTMDSAAVPLLSSKALKMVKIEPKLTVAAMKDKLAQAMVVAISQACKVLGLHCVAKRIESPTALQWLTAVGCDFAQGYALEKPMPIETIVSGKK